MMSTQNELSKANSPYLLQHVNNPVHWQLWSDDIIAYAQKNNKLLIVSIGYSACHWCHVMAHESFEDPETAQLMNKYFINIKVDREERPDLDAIYMKAIQLMTGRGGWPLNVVCLPDGRPVWGGTYFKKEDWMESLSQLQSLFENQPQHMETYAQNLALGIENIGLIPPNNNNNPTKENINNWFQKWQKSFDFEYGGYTRAPKFMMPNNLECLLAYGTLTQNESLLSYVYTTLDRMAWGGIFDTVGGGFSRYSVDIKWHIPHFEKMLYDNALLISLYAKAFKKTQKPLYAEVIHKTIAFIKEHWQSPDDSFYAAWDADSPNELRYSEEGAYYVWTRETLQELLGTDFELFAQVFNINDFGHWEDGKYVLIQTQSLENIANQNHIDLHSLQAKKTSWEALLKNSRNQRKPPGLDYKCITAWNAMMIVGLLDAYEALGAEEYLKDALKAAHFIQTKVTDDNENLFRNYTNGNASIPAFLEDYAFVIQAYIRCYTATFDTHWLSTAKRLTDLTLDQFFDTKRGFFVYTSHHQKAIIAPHFDTEDQVTPSANSTMAHNLLTLGILFENNHYQQLAQQMATQISPEIDYPSAFSNWILLLMQYTYPSITLTLCGKNALADKQKLTKTYTPNTQIFGVITPTQIPFFLGKTINEDTMYYWCEDKTCAPATSNFDKIATQLKSFLSFP